MDEIGRKLITLLLAYRALVSLFLHEFMCYCQISLSSIRRPRHFTHVIRCITMLDIIIANTGGVV